VYWKRSSFQQSTCLVIRFHLVLSSNYGDAYGNCSIIFPQRRILLYWEPFLLDGKYVCGSCICTTPDFTGGRFSNFGFATYGFALPVLHYNENLAQRNLVSLAIVQYMNENISVRTIELIQCLVCVYFVCTCPTEIWQKMSLTDDSFTFYLRITCAEIQIEYCNQAICNNNLFRIKHPLQNGV